MKVSVNKQDIEFEKQLTLSQLFDSIDMEMHSGMAVAVNEDIISSEDWHLHQLNDKDDILIITATQGG